VAFDFDGTLVDSNAAKRNAYFDVTGTIDPSGALVREVLADRAGADRHEVMRALAEAAAGAGRVRADRVNETAAELAAAYGALVEAAQAERPERPGASAALAVLGATRALYVNSATPEDSLRRAVHRRGWRERFRDVLGRPTDKATHLRAILAREGLAPSALAMVGDQQGDLDAARAVGCAFVGVASDGNDFQETVTLLGDLGLLAATLEARRP
jgi:phosphoglycolate phosphatase-like HAD superfamily hydrolase